MKKLLTTIAALAITSNVAAFEVTAERMVTTVEEAADNYDLCLDELRSNPNPIPLFTFMSEPCMAAAGAKRIEAMDAMLEADKKELAFSDEEKDRLITAYERVKRALAAIEVFMPDDWKED